MFLNLLKATVLVLVLHTARSACQTDYVFGDPVDPKEQSPNLRTITMWLENLSVSVNIPAERRGKCINVEDEVPPTWAEGACPDHVYIPPATSCIFFPGKDCQSWTVVQTDIPSYLGERTLEFRNTYDHKSFKCAY